MSLIYVLISKNNDKILCEYTEYNGNFEQVSRNLLKKVQPDYRGSFIYDEAYFFNYINQDNITYMCMSNKEYPRENAFAYLDDIKEAFLAAFSRSEIEKSISYTLNEAFQSKLKAKMDNFNKNIYTADKLGQLKHGLNQYKDNILNADDVLSKRGEKINIIVKKAETLRQESVSYYGSAKRVRNTIRWRRIKIIIAIVVVCILVAYFIAVAACKGFALPECFGN